VIVLITGATLNVFTLLIVLATFTKSTFVDNAESAIEALGKLTVPLDIVIPFPAINLPPTFTFPLIDESKATNNLPFKETSEPTNKRLFMEASLVK